MKKLEQEELQARRRARLLAALPEIARLRAAVERPLPSFIVHLHTFGAIAAATGASVEHVRCAVTLIDAFPDMDFERVADIAVAIARAVVLHPKLVLADEPTGNLDTRNANDVFDLFSKLVEQGKTMVMVTHDKELARRVPRVVEIIDGKITRDEFVGGAAWTGY